MMFLALQPGVHYDMLQVGLYLFVLLVMFVCLAHKTSSTTPSSSPVKPSVNPPIHWSILHQRPNLSLIKKMMVSTLVVVAAAAGVFGKETGTQHTHRANNVLE